MFVIVEISQNGGVPEVKGIFDDYGQGTKHLLSNGWKVNRKGPGHFFLGYREFLKGGKKAYVCECGQI